MEKRLLLGPAIEVEVADFGGRSSMFSAGARFFRVLIVCGWSCGWMWRARQCFVSFDEMMRLRPLRHGPCVKVSNSFTIGFFFFSSSPLSSSSASLQLPAGPVAVHLRFSLCLPPPQCHRPSLDLDTASTKHVQGRSRSATCAFQWPVQAEIKIKAHRLPVRGRPGQ